MENVFGKRLANARKIRCLSQRELCTVMGGIVSSNAIAKYETGRMLPSSSILIALSRALNMEIDYFFRPFIFQIDADKFEFRKKSSLGKKQEKNLFYRGLYHLLSCIPMQTYNRACKKFIEWTDRRPTGYLRCLGLPIVCAKGNTGYWRYRTEWLEDTVDYEFETYRLIGFRQSQLPLSRMYGDYLTPVCFPYFKLFMIYML